MFEMKKVEKALKMVKLSIAFVSMCCVFTMGMALGLETNSNANEYTTEEVLMQKDKIISSMVEYEEGVNPFFASSKAVKLSNLSLDKLNELAESGYTIYVVGSETNENLPEPVQVEGTRIIVSVHSNDGALVDTVNNPLAMN